MRVQATVAIGGEIYGTKRNTMWQIPNYTSIPRDISDLVSEFWYDHFAKEIRTTFRLTISELVHLEEDLI